MMSGASVSDLKMCLMPVWTSVAPPMIPNSAAESVVGTAMIGTRREPVEGCVTPWLSGVARSESSASRSRGGVGRREAGDLGRVDRAAAAENDDQVGHRALDRLDQANHGIEGRVGLQIAEDGKRRWSERREAGFDMRIVQERGRYDGKDAAAFSLPCQPRDGFLRMDAIVNRRLAQHGQRARRDGAGIDALGYARGH